MNIIDIRWRAYRLPFLHSFNTAHGALTAREGIIVQVITDQGIIGIGEIAPLPAFAGGSLADAFVLLPALAARLHHKTLREALDILLAAQKVVTKAASTLCGLEIALLDALGKAEECAVSALLAPANSAPRSAVPVNAVISARDTQAAIAAALNAKKNGYRCIKLKVGADLSRPSPIYRPSTTQTIAPSGSNASTTITSNKTTESTVGADLSRPPPIYRPPEKSPTSPHPFVKPHHYVQSEIERIAAVRDAIGPAMHLRLDANEAWHLEEAIAILSECVPYDIQYVEQPLKARDLAGMRALRQAVPIPIAVDESLHSLESAQLVLDNAAADILIIKPQLAGGLSAGQRIIQAAFERGIDSVITSAIEAGVGLVAALHLAAASPTVTLECGLATLDLLIDDLLINELPIRDGFLAVPTGPGLGVTLDCDALDKYRLGGLA
jgi:L-alanine-DL-glutamate epimerase-like enolase superfamily enzyme